MGLVKGTWLQITGRAWASSVRAVGAEGRGGRGLQPAGARWAGTCGRLVLLPGEGVHQLLGRSLCARELPQWLLGGGGGPLA